MNDELAVKLEELKKLIERNSTYQRARAMGEKLMNDDVLLKQIQDLKLCDNIYSENYRKKKQMLYGNSDYQKYQELETELYLLTLQINQILNQLTNQRGCHNENH